MSHLRRIILALAALSCGLLPLACGPETPSNPSNGPTRTATPSATETGTLTVTSTLTETGTPTATATITNTFAPGTGWAKITDYTSMSSRLNAGFVSMGGKLWVVGGYSSFQYSNDVWSSTDGANWTQVNPGAASGGTTLFSKRASHGCVAFNGMLWVFGGHDNSFARYNDVWNSSDGVVWTQVNPGAANGGTTLFSRRSQLASTVHNGKIWVVGGYSDNAVFENDTWSSPDGVTWTQENAGGVPSGTLFSGRNSFPLVSDGTHLWVLGGSTNSGPDREVWSSTNGASWTKTADGSTTPMFSARYAHNAAYYGGKLWVVGGYDNSNYFNDVWSSTDGANWTAVHPGGAASSTLFAARSSFDLAAFNGALWLLSGGDNGMNYSDIWRSP